MALVNPITNKQNLLLAEQQIKANNDPAFQIIWRIGIETGFRITDITELEYNDINWTSRTISIAENKGCKARKARARLKVLEQVKNELIAMNSGDAKEMMKIFITAPKDIYSLIPESMIPMVDHRITEAQSKTPEKRRTAKVSNRTIELLKARYERFKCLDDGFIFSRRTLKSNRARNCEGVITRQACWAVFSKLTDYLNGLGEAIKVGCHSLRKVFARHLYESSGKDIGLLMRTIGHSSPAMSLRYIGISDAETLDAQDRMFAYFEA